MASDYSGDEFEEDNYDDGHFVTSGPPSSRHDASEGSSFFGDGNGQDSIERMLGVLGKPSGGKTSPVDADARAVREMVASYSSNSIKLQSTPAIVPYKSNFDPPGAAPDSAEVEDDQEASQASYDDDGFAEDDGGDVEDTGEYSAADEPTPRPPPELPAPPPPSEVMELLSPQASAAAVKSSVARTFPIPSLVVDEQKEEGKHTQEEEEEEEERYTEDDAYGSDEFATDHEPVLSPKQSSLGNVAPSFSRHSLPRAQADEQEVHSPG